MGWEAIRGFKFLKGYPFWLLRASGLLGYADEENKASEDTATVVQGRVLGASTKMVRKGEKENGL